MQKPEKQLPFPVYFVYPDQSQGAGVFGAEYPPDPNTEPWRYYTTADCWVMLTYVHLKRRGFDVRLATRPVPESINVIAGYDLGIKNCAFDSYMVACRSDSTRPMICAHTIVQNPHNAIAPTEHLIQHWPQPGLLSRLPGRGDRVERIVFKGADYNLWKPFAGAEFRQALAMLGVEFRIDSWPEDRRQCRWHDYQDTDLVLAVRNLTEMDYYIKPASKLINAWHAGTPALLGPEPAFQALRRSELDYVEIRTPEEAVQAVRRLKEDPKLYRTMVENGRSRGANSRRTRSRLVGTRSWPTRSPPGSTAGGGAPPGLKRYPVPPGTPHLPPYIVGSAESTANSVTTATGPSPVSYHVTT